MAEEGGMTKVSLYLKIPLKSVDLNSKKTFEIRENRRIRFYPFPQDLKTFDATKKIMRARKNVCLTLICWDAEYNTRDGRS